MTPAEQKLVELALDESSTSLEMEAGRRAVYEERLTYEVREQFISTYIELIKASERHRASDKVLQDCCGGSGHGPREVLAEIAKARYEASKTEHSP